jgi:hypothetical protein
MHKRTKVLTYIFSDFHVGPAQRQQTHTLEMTVLCGHKKRCASVLLCGTGIGPKSMLEKKHPHAAKHLKLDDKSQSIKRK